MFLDYEFHVTKFIVRMSNVIFPRSIFVTFPIISHAFICISTEIIVKLHERKCDFMRAIWHVGLIARRHRNVQVNNFAVSCSSGHYSCEDERQIDMYKPEAY